MAIENIKILCQGFSWEGIVEPQEIYKVNFFTPVTPITLTEEIDLVEHLLELSKLSYQFDTASETGDGTNELFFLCSDIDLTLTNLQKIGTNKLLSSFFRIKEDTSFVKYRIKILYDDNIIFLGIIDQDGLQINYDNSNSSDVIKCKVLGFEKEFVDYYKSDLMKHNREIEWETHPAMPAIRVQESDTGGNEYEIVIPASLSLLKILQENFASELLLASNIRLESEIENYIVVQTPFFYQADNNSELIWPKTSYERVALRNSDNAENKWNWLKKMCNGMGWVVFFFMENNQFCMGIKNRSSINLPITELNVGDFSEYKIQKDKPNMTYNQIILIDGTLIGGDKPFENNARLKGEQLIIISDYTPQNFHTSFINTVQVDNNSYEFNFYNPYIHFYNENGDDFKYSKFTEFNDSEPELFSISKKKTVFVDVGFTKEAQFVNIDNKATGKGFTIGVTPSNNKWFVFGGAYAGMLMKRIGNKWQSYHEYVRTDTFYNNFKKFQNSRNNKKFVGTYEGLLLNPFQQFKLTNDDNGLVSSNDTYSIQAMNFDLINDTTELDLYVSKSENIIIHN